MPTELESSEVEVLENAMDELAIGGSDREELPESADESASGVEMSTDNDTETDTSCEPQSTDSVADSGAGGVRSDEQDDVCPNSSIPLVSDAASKDSTPCQRNTEAVVKNSGSGSAKGIAR